MTAPTAPTARMGRSAAALYVEITNSARASEPVVVAAGTEIHTTVSGLAYTVKTDKRGRVVIEVEAGNRSKRLTAAEFRRRLSTGLI